MKHLLTPEMISEFGAKNEFTDKGRYTVVIDSEITVKFGSQVSREQFDLLQAVYDTGTIPSPKPLEFHEITSELSAIFMSTLPGERSDKIFHKLDKIQQQNIADDLVQRLRALNEAMRSRTNDSSVLVSLGIQRTIKFPFLGFTDSPIDREDFVDEMMRLNPQSEELVHEQRQLLESLISPPSESSNPVPLAFCHMDIQPLNILLQDGKLSGLLDWDWAGWYTSQMEKYVMCSQCEFYDDFRLAMLQAWGCRDDPIEKLAIFGQRRLRDGHMAEMARLKKLRPKTGRPPRRPVPAQAEDGAELGGEAAASSAQVQAEKIIHENAR